MRREIEFLSRGVTLRGWLETPDQGEGPHPCICLSHGFGGVKELFLSDISAAFAAAGFASIVWDHPCFGDSDGSPRYEVDPWAQVEGYRDAITYAAGQTDIDADRVAIWGTSYSGGHVLAAAAFDARVACVHSQVPFISGWANSRRVFREEEQASLRARFEADRAARQIGKEPEMMDIFGPFASTCALPSPEEYDWVREHEVLGTPLWENIVTLRSVEMMSEYEAGVLAHRIVAPLQMVVTSTDDVTPSDIAQDAFKTAREPKRLIVLKGGHMEVYDAQAAAVVGLAIEWFTLHLMEPAPAL